MTDRFKVALVTGAARGIGWAVCEELAGNGWRVVVADLDEAAARDRASGRAELLGLGLDVRDSASVHGAVQATVERFDGLDLLVNNAGIQRHGALEELAWEDWAAVIDVNLHGQFHCLQAAGRHMLNAGHGAIVNIVSVAAERGTPGRAPYVVAKAALIGLTRTAAVEWAARGVRVNAVGPGYVDTDLMRDYIDSGSVELDPILQRTPMRRMANSSEIASVVRFLASDDASFVTGQVLFVDGGFLADFGVGSAATERRS